MLWAKGLPLDLAPMLATPLNTSASSTKLRADLKGPFFVSPKLDGIRCICTHNGMFTRRGHRIYGLDHVRTALKPLFQKDKSLVLDGELYSDRLAKEPGGFESLLSVITRLRRKQENSGGDSNSNTSDVQAATTASVLNVANSGLAFHIFDVMRTRNAPKRGTAGGKHRICPMRGGARGFNSNGDQLVIPGRTPFVFRKLALYNLQNSLPNSDAVKFVPHLPASDVAKARQHLRSFLALGYEGAVMRTFENKYEVGVRSKSMIKLVPWHDTEFRVLRFRLGAAGRQLVKASSSPESRAATVSKRGAAKKRPAAAKGGTQDVIRSVECISTNGTLFSAHVGVNAATARMWLEKTSNGEDVAGVYATVRYPRMTGRGIPRFGVVKALRGKSGQWFL